MLYDFNAESLGTSTTFSETVGGVTATFSSPGDPGGFTVGQTFFETLTGNVLFDPGPSGQDNLILQIDFDAPLTDISMLFATNSVAGVPLFLDAYFQGSLVTSTSATGTVTSSGFPEGFISLGGTLFDRVVISSSAQDLAVDDITGTTGETVPEPAGIVLTIGGLGLIGFRRFSRARN